MVTGLGRSLQKKGHWVEIIIPKYKILDLSCVKNFKVCLLLTFGSLQISAPVSQENLL